jgi:hypothetical protein
MFQIFPKGRTGRYFKARSASRDIAADRERISDVFHSIEDALAGSRAEHFGLNSRVNEVLALASVTLGNGSDDYLTREAQDTRNQDLLGSEIVNGQRRLKQLELNISHFQFLKTALLTRSPDFQRRAASRAVS